MAILVSSLLLATSLTSVGPEPFGRGSELRLHAAVAALHPATFHDIAAEIEHYDAGAMRAYVEQAAQLASLEVTASERRLVSVDRALSNLEDILGELQLATAEWEGLEDAPVGGLGLLAATAQILRLAIDLGDEEPGVLAALTAIDPLALADRPDLRRAASTKLTELAGAIE
jgi:hypothetical protein